ncbi:MAG: LemA family protein [Candidatus Paceibacterota bacterium]|jgi:LemA protein
MKKILVVLLAIIAIILLYGLFTYNRLVSGRENIDNQWAQVQTEYQRRFDLIPNLVESVKGVMKQEQSIFNALAEARTHYSGAQTVDEKAAAATEVEGALGKLLAIVENYPQLKSSDNVQTLMAQLEGTENRISVERKRFNDKVRDFNLMIKRFPSNIVAQMFGFSERSYFEAPTETQNAPKVEL